MVRDASNNFFSNAYSTPIIAFQHNWFSEGYFNGALSIHHGRQEWKVGVESDVMFLHENFSNVITDPSQFEPGTPPAFTFPGNQPSLGQRPSLEQSAFVQDMVRWANWTLSAGLRWDHYQLLVNQNALRPPFRFALFSARRTRCPRLLRPHFSDAVVRKYPTFQFTHRRFPQSRSSALARAPLPGRLL